MSETKAFEINARNIPQLVKGSGPIISVDNDLAQLRIFQVCYEKSNKTNEFISLSSGQEVLDYLDEVKNRSRLCPELILLDINMPLLDGFEVLKKIRNHEEFQKNPVIVMVTASEAHEDKEKAKVLGADGFFSKPTHVDDYVSFFDSI